MYWIKKERENSTVTDYYLEIIGTAISEKEDVRYFYEWNEISFNKQDDTLIVCTAPMAIKAHIYGYKYIFWSQGCWPEESLMRHNSKIRYMISSAIEKISLKNAKFLFFVSDTMLQFYQNKYRLSLENKCYIMPCTNDYIHDEIFTQDKYESNTFCYVGGISVWQCFEKTIELYSKIEKKFKNTKLLLLVKEKEEAKKYLDKYSVENYEIDYVPISELPLRLANVKFGFVLREDSPVNYVATPTKILTYISSGIIPIYSYTLAGMKSILDDTQYKIVYKNDLDLNSIIELNNKKINYMNILEEFREVYFKHYDKEQNVKNIKSIFEEKNLL